MSATDVIGSFDDNTKRELAAFLEAEQGKARIQTSINDFLGRCSETCQVKLDGSSLRRKDQECLSTCVNRFLDTSLYLVQQLQSKQQQSM
ncbi:translocase of the inner membrane [Cystobasidium minutum MCA 4210]|uniref:translocase of the inner membrane n=1 Tax=Cystobasidium minutum MCA 4210 TaxID=1397322 RepID=UPI0034CFCAE0|eukprot:jgi/Rhomi1/59445/CE59444_1568